MQVKYGVVWDRCQYAVCVGDSPESVSDEYVSRNDNTCAGNRDQWKVYPCIQILNNVRKIKWAPIEEAAAGKIKPRRKPMQLARLPEMKTHATA